jgi:tetratricopeptide (TPR) repeat protein
MKKYLGVLIILAVALSTSACKKITMSQKDVYTLNQKAASYMEQGDYDNAIARLVCINDLEDNHPEVYYNLGVAYIKKEDYEKAIEALNKATELKPDMNDAYYSLGVAYEMQTDAKIEELKKTTDGTRKAELKMQIAQNLKAIYTNYSKYVENFPEGPEKEQIKHQFDYLKDKYKNFLIPQQPTGY